jgi:hypothetical protein
MYFFNEFESEPATPEVGSRVFRLVFYDNSVARTGERGAESHL